MQVTTRGLRPVEREWSSSWEEIIAVVNSVLQNVLVVVTSERTLAVYTLRRYRHLNWGVRNSKRMVGVVVGG